jgi:hypothetical protein
MPRTEPRTRATGQPTASAPPSPSSDWGSPTTRLSARFLEHRLTALLPPPLPTPVPDQDRPAPFHTCDGCDRAFRTHDPAARCADCREGR